MKTKPKPKPKSTVVSLRVDPALHCWLGERADADGERISVWLRRQLGTMMLADETDSPPWD